MADGSDPRSEAVSKVVLAGALYSEGITGGETGRVGQLWPNRLLRETRWGLAIKALLMGVISTHMRAEPSPPVPSLNVSSWRWSLNRDRPYSN